MHCSRWCSSLTAWSVNHCDSLPHSVTITCWNSSTAVSRCWQYTFCWRAPRQCNQLVYVWVIRSPHVQRLNEHDALTSQVCQGVLGTVWWWHRVTVRLPAAGSTCTCSASILYECWLAYRHQACADSNSLMTEFLPIHNMPTETDSALNSSLRRACMRDWSTNNAWPKSHIWLLFGRNIEKCCT